MKKLTVTCLTLMFVIVMVVYMSQVHVSGQKVITVRIVHRIMRSATGENCPEQVSKVTDDKSDSYWVANLGLAANGDVMTLETMPGCSIDGVSIYHKVDTE